MSKYTEIVLENVLSRSKNPRYTQILEGHRLGIRVSPYTKIDFKNVLSG